MAYNSGNSFEIGTVLNKKWVILEFIAKGGMGEVFKAKHRMMDRMVALKVINQNLMQESEAVERFHREVKAAADFFLGSGVFTSSAQSLLSGRFGSTGGFTGNSMTFVEHVASSCPTSGKIG